MENGKTDLGPTSAEAEASHNGKPEHSETEVPELSSDLNDGEEDNKGSIFQPINSCRSPLISVWG